MNILFINGNIHSLDENNSTYEVLGIKDNTISFLGHKSDIKNIQNEYEKIINLDNKVMLPSFNDSHMHLLGYGYFKSKLNLSNCTSIDDLITESKNYIIYNKLNKNDMLIGRGWNQDNFKEKRIPTRLDLDKISTEIPIIFKRACGHISICNSKAIELLKTTNECLENNHINLEKGLFSEDGLNVLNSIIKNPSLEELKKMILLTCNELLENGITSVQSDDFCALPIRDCDIVLKAFNELSLENKLPVRVYEQCLFENISEFKMYLNNNKIKFHSGNNFFKIGPLKLLLDGALGGRTALLNTPYEDDKNNLGIANLDKSTLDEFIKISNDNNMQVAVHAIGDKAIDWVLDSYEKFSEISNPLRHGIVHCQLTTKNSLNKMKKLNTLAYIQPIFLHYDLHIVENRIGTEKAKDTYAFNTMNNMGISISSGSDCPVEHFNVMNGIHCAVNRTDLQNYPKNGWLPNEKLSVLDALKSYTINGAYSSFEENIKGTLETGKLADMVVLDKDIFSIESTKIKNINILMTIVDGEIKVNKLI